MGSAGKGEAWAFGTMLGILQGIWRHGQKTQDVGPCGMGQLVRSVQLSARMQGILRGGGHVCREVTSSYTGM